MPLQQSHDRDLADDASPALDLRGALRLVHEPGRAPDEGLVYFDFAAQLHDAAALHGEAEPVPHEPRGLLGDSKRPRHFVGADAVLVVDQHPERGQPLVQSDRRILEDRPDLDRELLAWVLGPALPAAVVGEVGDLGTPAGRAGDAVRPPQPRQELLAGIGVGKDADRFQQGLGGGL